MPLDFARLGVPANLVTVLAQRAITTPTPIQAATLPDSLAGRDVLGRGRTGSGKTYAFLLPLVARLAENRTRPAPGRPRALILAPTRELVAQIEHDPSVARQAVWLILVARYLERMADHITNIGERVFYVETGNLRELHQ